MSEAILSGGHSKNQVIIQHNDSEWMSFENPLRVVQTFRPSEVLPCLEEIESLVSEGFHAAGFLSYEAAPAFDSAISVNKEKCEFPLLWFGIYRNPVYGRLPSFENEEIVLDWDQIPWFSQYSDSIDKIKSYIESGDTYQVNYSFRMHAPFTQDPWELFCAIAQTHPVPYAAYLDTGRFVINSFSPELFFELKGEEIFSIPMKGTAPRGRFSAEDQKLAENLRNSEKDRAENIMIVDMIRNDLGKIAAVNSVQVSDLFRIERFPSVLQMTSRVSARVTKPVSEIFKALFPCASITGAPKIRTTQIISELENTPRKVYCGAIGYIQPQRVARFNVAIRTLIVDRLKKDAEYSIGSGIIWDSDASEEYKECLNKALVVTNRSPQFDLLETIKWTPQQGYFLLQRHLQRLRNSIEYFDFSADIENVNKYLLLISETFKSDCQLRVRIVVNRNGEITHTTAPLKLLGTGKIRLGLSLLGVDSSSPFLFHKTTNRSIFKKALETCPGCDDVILWNESGEVTETNIGNLVIELDGHLLTPELRCGLLPGVYREELLCQGKIGSSVITIDQLKKSSKIYRINSVREWERCELLGSDPG